MDKEQEASTVKAVLEKEGMELQNLANILDSKQITNLCNIIYKNPGNIFITGCGTSAMAAKKIVHTLNVIGERAFYLNPSDAVHGELGVINNKDIVIFISKGGNTKELTSFLDNVKEKGAYIIAITENIKSIIAKNSDYLLNIHVRSEADKFNMLATTSTLAVISLFDGIAISLINKKNFNKKNFLINHPSGDVGHRLLNDTK